MEREISAAVEEAVALKTSAKSARHDEDWESAIEDASAAVDVLRNVADSSTERDRQRVRAELADTYGTLGGIHRRLAMTLDGDDRREHLIRSVVAYDEGFGLEAGLPAREASTYNQVNRILGRLFVAPEDLTLPAVESDLQDAAAAVRDQVAGSRQRDPWAYCDLCTLQALLGQDDAWKTLSQLRALRPPAFVLQSWSTTLAPLTEAVGVRRPGLTQLAADVSRLASVTS
jgi:hypothetical protein